MNTIFISDANSWKYRRVKEVVDNTDDGIFMIRYAMASNFINKSNFTERIQFIDATIPDVFRVSTNEEDLRKEVIGSIDHTILMQLDAMGEKDRIKEYLSKHDNNNTLRDFCKRLDIDLS